MLEEIPSILSASQAKRADPSAPIWTLGELSWWRKFQDHGGLEAVKARVLRAIWNSDQPVFLAAADDPPMADVAILLQPMDAAWRVRTTIDPDVFLRSDLGFGNWALYVSPKPLSRVDVPNTFRLSAAGFLAFLRDHNISVYIDSFHDDDPWHIAVNPDLVEIPQIARMVKGPG